MNTRMFKDSDIKSLNKWLSKRGAPTVEDHELPYIGFIVPGVAVGFIRQAEGGVAMLEGFCSNPWVSSATRHRAMDAIFSSLLTYGNYKKYFGYTVDAGTFMRAQTHGFRPTDYVTLVKE